MQTTTSSMNRTVRQNLQQLAKAQGQTYADEQHGLLILIAVKEKCRCFVIVVVCLFLVSFRGTKINLDLKSYQFQMAWIQIKIISSSIITRRNMPHIQRLESKVTKVMGNGMWRQDVRENVLTFKLCCSSVWSFQYILWQQNSVKFLV